ncbi:hypothetical protein GCM10010492_54550 [Saccharothrix mutabilis subsp. mutabilis]|uniref:Transmembrane protein n=1 Tax=Saccharothrix mutabilis subsp. mutabilis TaxID=66855 RepID=A0ABN0UEJ4_9PSEU
MNTRSSARAGRRLMRPVLHWRNPLAGLGDRLEGAVLVVAVVTTMLGLPVAAALGSETYTAQAALSRAQQATRHRTDAVLLADAPSTAVETGPGTGVGKSPVPAQWTLPDGRVRRGEVEVDNDLVTGTTVRIWVDAGGAPVAEPLTAEAALISAVVVAVASWLALGGGMALLVVLFRSAHQRVRLRRWGRDWAEVEPTWRRQA